jgi:elongator complex protein 1
MRNLRNTRRSIRQFPDVGLPLTALTWDPSTNDLICAFGPSELEAIIELKRLKDDTEIPEEGAVNIASWDAPCPNPHLEYDQILNLHYFADTAAACLTLAGGDIVVVREQPLPGEDAIEIVGSVDAGISAAEWSPDEELLAMVTKADTVVYMTRDFEATVNITLSSEDLKASSHVSVGWGKSETQFKGKRAKALRDPTVPERVDEGALSDLDDHRVSITWRGDGAYVAINTIEAERRRLIRIYSREGAIDSVSEPVDGLESPVSWRPAGNLIACAQRLSDRVDTVFFERNGLRHGQFSLRLSPEDQKTWGSNIALQWNSDSTILAVSFLDRVQFWTMGNYHYYLKQEIKTISSEPNTAAIKVHWHPEKPTRVALSEASMFSIVKILIGQNTKGFVGIMQNLEFIWTVSSGPNKPPDDTGTVGVIDGRKRAIFRS